MPRLAAPPLTTPLLQGPTLQAGTWVWKARHGDVEVRFTGRGPAGEREEVLRRVEPEAPPMAWAKQIHSAIALPARPGFCGEGDALYTEEAGLALSVMTADCVPVLVAGPEGLAAIHAGWRGIVGGIIPAALETMKGRPEEWTAWVGPAIGVCCYEVGEDVAARVGVGDVVVLTRCTRCDEETLWSYRREGKRAGRDLGFIWRRPGG